ncbi:hypothetical protein LEP1GSC043_0301 [Leptospira weilii str. Ecochallenge]|uniref:Uncharacterized protein n=1 Tax=Leptospira weilii str. Ecochallenge TaxID=1049986 RepID=N1U788_9LEPT|nr:hypothetical protein LEP1GSC051_0318 [Leptospira sp. P2653]EMN44326.1 hypothetical protein LEP1GSC086_0927 [Leptospira weilii str. LNT 1234]EMY14937.1 hypothetical protein LEP1GSC043_0301 [Leptospira weilii str. Ecochallenge]
MDISQIDDFHFNRPGALPSPLRYSLILKKRTCTLNLEIAYGMSNLSKD